MELVFGMYAPERLNSWAEYAAAVPDLDRVFFCAGVERHEKQKMELVGRIFDETLAARAAKLPVVNTVRAAKLPVVNTVRADELAVGDVLEFADASWRSHMPGRETFTVAAIERTGDGTFTATFVSSFGATRTRTRTALSADRRFTKAL
ncbi:hypothetical protein [Arthrobacter sp. PAMC25284]|uniref:hypothetical protein n=1 Tax=Arthrobacter sp. PAMC25284 TaxID=2861279 RepID=UPI001C636C6C|nr:hypothetical protein [Arthrobacter sp. PAMC25284]QYF88507.1 hypothetical protein KY499_09425 [Arthrobacter sp. PAMC25284]